MREVIATTWGWEESWQRTDFARKLTQCEVSIIEIDGQPGGSLWLEMRPDARHIAELQLLPALQGRGAGQPTRSPTV